MTRFYKAQTRFLFHAHVKIKLPVFADETCFDRLFCVMADVDRRFNSYTPGSSFSRINAGAGRWVDVDDETLMLLRRVLGWSAFFAGAFDVSVMPLIRLWGFYRNEHTFVPTPEAIEATRRRVDWRHIEVDEDGRRVRIDADQELITGSFLKAYAVDKVVEELGRMGIDDAIINAGGSTIRALNNAAHRTWSVNVTAPDDCPMSFGLNLSGRCYTTSSQSETYVSIGGHRYGHILDPRTGCPSANRMVGLVTDNCMDGDILTTGLFLQTPAEFTRLVAALQKRLPVEGFLLDANGGYTATSGFAAFTFINVQ